MRSAYALPGAIGILVSYGMPRLTISPVRISCVASNTFIGVIRLPLPRWSSSPQRDLNQSALSTGLAVGLVGVSSIGTLDPIQRPVMQQPQRFCRPRFPAAGDAG